MQKISTDRKKIDELLTRGVDKIYPSEGGLREALLSGKKLRVKFGIDPTGTKIHIGRAVVFRKLRQFQELGHQIVLIIGDFTAQIGDPSDKLEKRPFLKPAQVQANLKNYIPQIGKIINIKKTEIKYNSVWLKKFSLQEVTQLAEQFTIQQMLQRRNFKERLSQNQDISLRELFYPLMQGYDSVAVHADVELGGTDQLFNLMAGRKLQERYRQKPQLVLTVRMLNGLDGRKMSTSWGNVINILDTSKEQFGKVMSMRDEEIIPYFILAADLPMGEIREREKLMKQGILNPRDAKAELARRIVAFYHGEAAARKADHEFVSQFKDKETPKNIPVRKLISYTGSFPDKLVEAGLCSSKSEARRLIEQGGVKIDGSKVDFKNGWDIILKKGSVIQVGKHKFVKIA
ncbi:MAG: tyrosine--tRNA ligase [Candidatus Komeilibacteria bacterium RIFCSPLOWO2_01_FULL_52_15]|uniref:Tyrosine--tRNA ligase n=2 Tax=Candidatus Komeiliibacteriota TaxID=1817908 RepID=A0A1G2BQF0_9BACT|nr:MAG: tyrosine--tRNA ligase [Candidatus Komeilibacteria bacterium RIFCSPHIGHO2_01_FULL_52_14]OGY91056.1 MAG: tyrosine--tRNA ligase [Candidatus Komeilibacteria bacterium RIFCSPLOWO2_01_FULL_52_15]